MKITCNGETREIAADTTLVGFIKDMELNPNTVVAEYNGHIVKRDEYNSLILENDSVLELIRFVGGG